MTETIDLLAVLRDGLPRHDGQARHVVVVGAGIAGLTLALLLKDAGHRVSILESQGRMGGRILTHRGFSGTMYGEFGAMRFPRQHHLGQHLIHERFALPTTSFGMEDEDTLIHLNGVTQRRRDFRVEALGVDLPDHERGRDPRAILRGAMQPLVERAAEPGGWSRIIEEFDRYSLLGWLTERGVSEQALTVLGPLLNLEGRFHFSLVEWFTHWHEDVFGDLEYLTAGSDTLIDAFAPALLDDVRLGARVQSIDQGPSGVSVVHRDGVGRTERIDADECVITAPFILLRHMEIAGLDAEKRFAIRNVYYGRAHKIIMQFARRWWEDEGITHGVTVTDLAIRNVVYTPAGQDPSTSKGVIIASYGWEQDSMAYSMLSEHDRIAQALEDLTRLHPAAATTFEAGLSHDWSLDPNAGGIGPLFRPLEMTSRYYDDVVRPVGRVWFANDACDRRGRRWIEGALAAAVRNAYAIHTGMRDALPRTTDDI